MIRRAPAPPSPASDDPSRLLLSGDGVADLMRAYARQTRPGDRETVAAWYRLRPALDAGARTPARRWTGARLLSGAFTAALVLLVATKLLPSPGVPAAPRPSTGARSEGQARGGVGLGGASGWGEPGAGGTEGSSGSRGLGETAAVDAPAPGPRRAG